MKTYFKGPQGKSDVMIDCRIELNTDLVPKPILLFLDLRIPRSTEQNSIDIYELDDFSQSHPVGVSVDVPKFLLIVWRYDEQNFAAF